MPPATPASPLALVLAAALVLPALPALAADQPAGGGQPSAAWAPPKVKNEARDRKEIAALWDAFDEADRKGEAGAAAALIDFPVLMVTDDPKGQAVAQSWSREQWLQVMAPFYKADPSRKVKHKPQVFLVSDSLASVDDVVTAPMNGKPVTMRNTTLLVRKDGKWLVKVMTEGGWGDMMAGGSPGAGSAAPSSAPGSAAGSASGGGAATATPSGGAMGNAPPTAKDAPPASGK
jgi:hypothetical protein